MRADCTLNDGVSHAQKGVLKSPESRSLPLCKACVPFRRAKKTHGERSDYDLGVEWDTTTGDSWGAFTTEVREEMPSLHQLDLARLDMCGDDLKGIVLNEGFLIYERETQEKL
jgi:hypothetical protein